MDIPDQFLEIDILLADDGFIAVLKKLAVAFVPLIEADGIAGQQSSHKGGEATSTGPQEEVGVVGHQNPGAAGDRAFGNEDREAVKEVVVVLFVTEDFSSFDSPDHNVVKESRGIESCLSWHGVLLSCFITLVNLVI